ncbi:hypothetical protein [Deinococcus taeanensis]|nr:hypothetical protein [Deinococcus taeanensis]
MLDDSLDLAVDGVYGTVDDISSETIDILETYGAALADGADFI